MKNWKRNACRLAALLLLPLCLAALSGCGGGQQAAAPTSVPANAQAAAAAGKQGAAADQASQAGRAESEARGKAAVEAQQSKTNP